MSTNKEWKFLLGKLASGNFSKFPLINFHSYVVVVRTCVKANVHFLHVILVAAIVQGSTIEGRKDVYLHQERYDVYIESYEVHAPPMFDDKVIKYNVRVVYKQGTFCLYSVVA